MLKENGHNITSVYILKYDIFYDTNIHCLSHGIPEKAKAIRLRRFKNAIISSHKFMKNMVKFVFISIRTNDH